tara:strand:- start:25 stop:453 length:429 start_codon:yes stop_codon:yes gene_type:complete
MNNVKVRKTTREDFALLSIWWMEHGEEPPLIDQLPDKGLGGFIVEKNNKPIAATYLYLTNSSIAYIANAISDIRYKSKDRFEIIRKLLNACEKQARTYGCDFIFCTSSSKGVIKRCIKSGYNIVDKQHDIIAKTLINGKNFR